MILSKIYKSAFIVEKSKLTRLLSLIKDALNQSALPYTELFHVDLIGNKTVHTNAIEQILELDNSKRSAVQRLLITCSTKGEPNEDPTHWIQVDFNGHKPVDIAIEVRTDDQKIANEAMSVAEEQVERMLERSIMYRIYNMPREFFLLLGMSVGIFVITMLFSLSILGSRDDQNVVLYRTMWLTPKDLVEIQSVLQDTESLSPEQGVDILARQIRNLTTREWASVSPFAALADWRVIVIILPSFVLISSFIALGFCYHPAVFAWGDAEELYRKVVARRGWIWNAVVVTLVLGIIGNLAVFALGSLVSGGGT